MKGSLGRYRCRWDDFIETVCKTWDVNLRGRAIDEVMYIGTEYVY
jgi:hypothetical protein